MPDNRENPKWVKSQFFEWLEKTYSPKFVSDMKSLDKFPTSLFYPSRLTESAQWKYFDEIILPQIEAQQTAPKTDTKAAPDLSLQNWLKRRFDEWLKDTYTAAERTYLAGLGEALYESEQWSYFERNVAPQNPQYSYFFPEEKQPLGRYESDPFGIVDTDWERLMTMGVSGERIQAQTDKWIAEGKISEGQAAYIWDELSTRWQNINMRRSLYVPETEKERAAKETERLRLKAETDREDYLQKRVSAGLFPQPQEYEIAPPEYGTAEENLPNLPGAETEDWRRWFSSRFPSVIREFEKKTDFTVYPGGATAEQRKQGLKQGWQDYFDTESRKLVERYWKQGPYARGERPAAFAPRIQTVKF